MTLSYFRSEDSGRADEAGFFPLDTAVGPWAPDMLHGRFFGGLAARALEADFVEDGWRVARLTVDLFRPAGFELITVRTQPIREGRRLRVADAFVSAGGTDVAAVRAVILTEGTPPPGDIWQAPVWDSAPPESYPKIEHEDGPSPLEQAWDIRVAEGGVRSSERSRVWTNDSGVLLDGEPLSPVVRAALSADLASPLSNGSDTGIGYINGDYTLAMARYPRGEWVGLETTTHLAEGGIALGTSTMYDLDGPFGTSTTTALANPLLA